MDIITKREKIKDIVQRFGSQNRGQINKLNKLKQLDLDKATEEEVNKIIGNSSWTSLICNNCKKEREELIIFEDGDCHEVQVCKNCLKIAQITIETIQKEGE